MTTTATVRGRCGSAELRREVRRVVDMLPVTAGADDDVMASAGMASSMEVPLRRGDSVVCVKGDLRHLQGRVVAVNEGRGTFILHSNDPRVTAIGVTDFELGIGDVVKFFHVRPASVALCVCAL